MSVPNKRGLRLLSIDGGGIRGLSALLILREALYRMQQQQGLAEIPRPCDVFDLAGGAGTGGIIVIILFRLQMTIDDAINAYVYLTRHVFSERQSWPHRDGIFKESRLEDAIVKIISAQLKVDEEQAKELRILDVNGPKCFVCTTTVRNMASPTLFRSWIPDRDMTYNCTIVEACRATTAAMPFFKSIDIGTSGLKETFIGGILYNNPIRSVQNEAKYAFPDQAVACLVSIGAGVQGVIGLEQGVNSTTVLLTSLLEQIVSDCEATSREIVEEYSTKPNVYFRLSVEHGLQGVGATRWEELPAVKSHTRAYLKQHDVDQKVHQLVQVLVGNEVPPTILYPTDLSPVEQSFVELQKAISFNAYHDFQVQSTSSGCLPGTRKAEIKQILEWIGMQGNGKRLFVVLGSAGSGKSSLLRTVGKICQDKGSYAAGFCFSRTDPERNTSDRLISTIVYQICEAIPELRPYVARVVEMEAGILSRPLQARLDRLLLRPLCQCQSDHPSLSFHPRTIFIDALDACGNANDQSQVIGTLTGALSRASFPFLCVLSSRFDRHIEGVFYYEPLIHIGMTLGGGGAEEMQDIRSYLDHMVKDIRKRHPCRALLSERWPAKSDLETIVARSGGQFIYAATVIGYIQSPDHNPQDRLQSLVASESGTNAFDALDDFYRALMASIEDLETAKEILGIELVRSSPQFWMPDAVTHLDFIKDHFVKLDADIVLASLASVLKFEDHHIKFYHLSFSEFLLDPARSREFCVHPTKWQKWIVSHLGKLFYDGGILYVSDVTHLIEEATPGTELHQAINEGLELVINRLPNDGGNFNIWPFVTKVFLYILDFTIFSEQIANVFLQHGKACLPLPVLITLAPSHKLSNSFLLFELCRTIASLKVIGLIHDPGKNQIYEPDAVLLYMTYLANYFDDQRRSGQNVLTPEDYYSATLRCLWYLHTSRCDILSSLKELCSLKRLPAQFGIPRYLRDASNNISRGALEALFSLLPQSPPSVDLLAALKKPFDNEVILMNPSLSRKARNFIHEYLMLHDADYQGDLLEETDSAEEDEPLPHFDMYLIQDQQYDLSSECLNGWEHDNAEKVNTTKAMSGSKKDPWPPRRGLSPYMFFSQDWRERIKTEIPDAGFGEIGKLLGAKWMEMSDEEKKPYIDQAAKDKERADKERAAYDAQSGGDDSDDEE